MKKINVSLLPLLLMMAACQTTSNSTIRAALDTPEKRPLYFKEIAEAVKKYPWFDRYVLTKPKTLVITEARIQKLVGWIHGRYSEESQAKAGYCLVIWVQNPEVEGVVGRAASVFKASVLEDSARPGWFQARIAEGSRQPLCYMSGETQELPGLIGHRFERNR